MNRPIVVSALALALSAGAGQTEEPRLVPFPTAWEEPVGGAADLSFLLKAPAGRDGFVIVRDGHLAEADGSRLRIWGINLSAAGGLPRKEDAPRLAAILARHGLNGVRFHYFDRPAPGGILPADASDTRTLDPEQLDRLDFLVAELKKRGIYTNINLNVARRFREGDGVRDHELLGFAKGLTHFDERLIELQKEYARQLLTHRNPYTGAEYRHEPAVAIVEMVNENSIVESWFSDRLLGRNTRPNPGTWTDIPASYEAELTARYQAWLAERLSAEDVGRLREEAGVGSGQDVPRLTREGFADASDLRFHTEAAFYIEIEDRFFQQMRTFLREELGVRSLLVGSSDHNHGNSGYPLLASTARLDVVDGHVYWQHPHYLDGRLPSGQSRFEIPNTPMVADPRHSTVVQLARSAVDGKPYTVSEVNHPFPHRYSSEGIPILAAYGALQDWDGIFWYTFEHRRPDEWEPRARGHFDLRPDPVKMAQLAAGALMFLRGDVARAEGLHRRSYTEEDVRESLRLSPDLRPFFTPGFDHALPLRTRTRIRGFDGGPSDSIPPADPGPVVSDTGQLRWHSGAGSGLVTVETHRSEAVVGFPGTHAARPRHLDVAIENDFAAVTLSALDDQPLARSGRLLLTAGARVINTGSRWNEAGTGLVEWGGAPALVEPVRGRVVLRGLDAAARVEATALDPGGRLTAKTWPAVRTDGGWQIELGREPTVWYVVDVARKRGTAPAPPPPDTAPSDPLPAPRLVLDNHHSTPVLTTRSPGAEDVRWGFEGGRVVKVSDTYHLFTSEMVDDPMWVKMRLGHWTSPDRLTWSREGTVRESSGEFEGQDPRASLWSPLPIWDETEDRWNLFHVAYHSAPGDGTEFRLNHEGRIVRLVSETPGPEGILGPWKDMGVVMKPGPDSLPWEGLQGTDSFFAWPVGDGWRAFYGSARSEVMPIEHWLVGPAEAPSLGGPWRRVAEDNPSPIEERFIENPIVTPAPEGGWLVVYDGEGEDTIGWSHSDDGIHFGPGQRLVIQPEPGVWAKDVRTAMGLVSEGNGRFTLFYTGFEQMPDWDRLLLGKGQETCAIGFVELRLERP